MALEVGADSAPACGAYVKQGSLLGEWAGVYYTLTCYACGKRAAPSNPKAFRRAVGMGSDQWRGAVKDQEFTRQHGSIMRWPCWRCTACCQTKATPTLGEEAAAGRRAARRRARRHRLAAAVAATEEFRSRSCGTRLC